METESSSSSVYEIAYHIVWCPKYRRTLPDSVRTGTKTALKTIAAARGWEIRQMEVMPDHVHIFLSTPPTESPVSIVKTLKGVSARVLFDDYPQLRNMFRKGHLWSPSYYVGTVGHVSEETVARYVAGQKLRTQGRRRSSTD